MTWFTGRTLRRARAKAMGAVVCTLVWAGAFGSIVSPALAGGYFPQTTCNSYGCGTYTRTYYTPQYVQPQVVEKTTYVKPEVQVVNNLIAVPVAVPYLQPIAQQGQTGYAYGSLQTFPTYNPAAVFAQSERLATAGNDLAREGLATFQAVHAAEVDAKERVQTINATAQAFAAMSQEFQRNMLAASSIRSQKLSSRTGYGGAGQVPVQPPPGGADQTFGADNPNAVLKKHCASCHDALKDWGALSAETQEDCLARMQSREDGYGMPRAADKKSLGHAVPFAEYNILYNAWKARTN